MHLDETLNFFSFLTCSLVLFFALCLWSGHLGRCSRYCVVFQMTVYILRSYINDLTVQNAILEKNFKDLEADANGRVARLEAWLQKESDAKKVIQ